MLDARHKEHHREVRRGEERSDELRGRETAGVRSEATMLQDNSSVHGTSSFSLWNELRLRDITTAKFATISNALNTTRMSLSPASAG